MTTTAHTPFHSSPRRSFRLTDPRQQAGLTLAILATTLLFVLLGAGNSYAAYKSLLDVALSTVPIPLGEVLLEQTRHYVTVTSILGAGYALAVFALSVIFVRRMIGPVVAIERHVRALKSGNYSSRIKLRTGRSVFSAVAHQLNELAMRLHREAIEAEQNEHDRAQAA